MAAGAEVQGRGDRARAWAPRGGSSILAALRASAPTISWQYSAVAMSAHATGTSSSARRMCQSVVPAAGAPVVPPAAVLGRRATSLPA